MCLKVCQCFVFAFLDSYVEESILAVPAKVFCLFFVFFFVLLAYKPQRLERLAINAELVLLLLLLFFDGSQTSEAGRKLVMGAG